MILFRRDFVCRVRNFWNKSNEKWNQSVILSVKECVHTLSTIERRVDCSMCTTTDYNQQVILKRCENTKNNEFFRMRVEWATFLLSPPQSSHWFPQWATAIYWLQCLLISFIFSSLIFCLFVFISSYCSHSICKPNESTPNPYGIFFKLQLRLPLYGIFSFLRNYKKKTT